ncbi:MAG: hypothetical protein AB7I27_17260 [Bacteriovoracaceae bacterium]
MIKPTLKIVSVIFLTFSMASFAADCESNYAKLGIKGASRKIVKANLSQASKFALSTEAGKETLQAFGLKNTAELTRFIEQVDIPLNKLFRHHLLQVLHEIDQHVATFRGQLVAQGKIKAGKNAATELTEEEKILIEILTQRMLRPNPEAAEVLKNPTKAALKEAKFFLEPPKPKLDERMLISGREAQGNVKTSIIKDSQKIYNGMKECVSNMPKTELSLSGRAVKESLKQVLVSEVVTVGAVVGVNSTPYLEKLDKMTSEGVMESITSGIADIHVKELSINLIMTAISNGAGTFLLNGNASIRVSWMQSTVFHAALDTFSAGIYFLTPAPNDKYTAPLSDYFAFIATWGVVGEIARVPVNLFLTGVSCLYPQARWLPWVNFGTRMGFSVGVNVLYFVTANSYLYPQPTGEKK